MKLNPYHKLSALCATLLIGGCSSDSTTTTSGDNYTDGVPELAAVQMRITGDESSEALATPDDAVDPSAIVADELATVTGDAGSGGTSDLNGAREAVHDLNQAMRDALQSIIAIVRNGNPTYELGDLRMWGPVVRGDTEFRFIMRHPGPHDFQWRLDGRIAGSGTAYSRIAAGEIAVGIRPRRGIGVAGFDLSILGSVDPTVIEQGQILVGFAHGTLGTTLAFGIKGFTRDPAAEPGVDALLQEVHLANEVNRVRLAYHGNVEGTATAAEELVFARVRHLAGIGGRSDMIVTSGDVPAGQAWIISQCWDAALDQTYRLVRDCPVGSPDDPTCTVVSTVGDETACDVSLRVRDLPPNDPNQLMTDPQNPNGVVTPPAAIPDVTGDPADAG